MILFRIITNKVVNLKKIYITMNKFTFEQEVYLKSTKEKVVIRSVIKKGDSVSYGLYNGDIVNGDQLLLELPSEPKKRGRKPIIEEVKDETND